MHTDSLRLPTLACNQHRRFLTHSDDDVSYTCGPHPHDVDEILVRDSILTSMVCGYLTRLYS